MHYLLRTGNIVMPYVEAWREGLKKHLHGLPENSTLPIPDNVISLDQYRKKRERESHR